MRQKTCSCFYGPLHQRTILLSFVHQINDVAAMKWRNLPLQTQHWTTSYIMSSCRAKWSSLNENIASSYFLFYQTNWHFYLFFSFDHSTWYNLYITVEFHYYYYFFLILLFCVLACKLCFVSIFEGTSQSSYTKGTKTTKLQSIIKLSDFPYSPS